MFAGAGAFAARDTVAGGLGTLLVGLAPGIAAAEGIVGGDVAAAGLGLGIAALGRFGRRVVAVPGGMRLRLRHRRWGPCRLLLL